MSNLLFVCELVFWKNGMGFWSTNLRFWSQIVSLVSLMKENFDHNKMGIWRTNYQWTNYLYQIELLSILSNTNSKTISRIWCILLDLLLHISRLHIQGLLTRLCDAGYVSLRYLSKQNQDDYCFQSVCYLKHTYLQQVSAYDRHCLARPNLQ